MTEPAEPLDAAGIRTEVRSWIAANWDPDRSLVEWRTRLADSGWACPAWPRQWCGRSLPASATDLVAEELARAGAVGVPDGVGMHLAAPTLLEHGSDELKGRLIRPTVTGAISFCQLFSEPGAGSDLAALTTRAVLDGDQWVVNGQKVWNTSAHHADFGLLVARTDWDVPKHQGITYFVIPMHQPGVEVRPLRQMNGYASFNEVFLDDARVPVANLVGEVGHGWTVAQATLAHERRYTVMGSATPLPDTGGRAVREAGAERAVVYEPYKWYPQRAGRFDLVVGQAAATGAGTDPVVRQEIARLVGLARSASWTAQRSRAARALGRPPGPEGSLGKMAASQVARASSRVHTHIAGASGLLTGPDSVLGGTIAEIFVSVPAVSIAGGTDEIQHNIIGERVLGLPREPDPSHQLPFRDVPKNTGA
ncbi:MAG TPA: acyl-CoA dehydrogenase family protein [Acidimicrobiales bacterium]|nr:acyl-CoA dehydrogenase family protein [Acidimicrobiales bacterium]